MSHDNYSRVRFIARELNDLTPHNWKGVQDEHGNLSIVAENGLELWLRFGGYGNEGKIKIGYSRPRDRKGGYVTIWSKVAGEGQINDPSIKVSESKNADVIAKDIVRRLLSDAEAVHLLVKEAIKSNESYEDKKGALAEELANVCHSEARNVGDGLTPSIDLYKGIKKQASDYRLGYGTITVNGDSADFKLSSVPAEMAKKLAGIIFEALQQSVNRTV